MRTAYPFLAQALALVFAGCAGGEVVSVSARKDVEQKFLFIKHDQPAASVILFPGGHGNLKLTGLGIGQYHNNFLVRTRSEFAAQGFNVAVVDTPSDHAGRFGLHNFRTSPEHVQDIKAVIAFLRERSNKPVWVIGTSRGTISAANVAAGLEDGGPDGLILTSSVFRSYSATLKGAIASTELEKIRVPTLFVHHKEDGCEITSFADVERHMKMLSNAPRVELISFEGGSAEVSKPCQALSRHGFIGIEEEVVKQIGDWIKTNSPR